MKLLLVKSGDRGLGLDGGREIWVGWGPGCRVLGIERYTGKVGTNFHMSFTFPCLVSPSQLQKQKSAPRNDSRLEKRLGTT